MQFSAFRVAGSGLRVRRFEGRRQAGWPEEHVIEVTLAADGDTTILVWEERPLPVHLLAGYGEGIQVHVEDLAAHLAGRERCDGTSSSPPIKEVAAGLSE